MRSSVYTSYWAKTSTINAGASCQLLPYHLLDTAAVACEYLHHHAQFRKYLAALLSTNENAAADFVCFFTALHDIGKFAETFQGKEPVLFQRLRGRAPRKFGGPRHDVLARALWPKILPLMADLFSAPFDTDCDLLNDSLMFLYDPSAGHHGKPIANSEKVCLEDCFSENDHAAASELVRDLINFFLKPHAPYTLPRASDSPSFNSLRTNSWRLAGLTVLCDWLASAESFFPYVDQPMLLDDYWQKHAVPHARKALAAAGILAARVATATGMAALFPKISAPSDLQFYAENCPLTEAQQLFVIEDVTGSGKTEAALVLAHRLMAKGLADGLYFALPTMATANAMYERLAASYDRLYDTSERPSLVLAHSARMISERFTETIIESGGSSQPPTDEQDSRAQCAAWIADHRKKALLAQVGVGTIDQALVGVLPVYHQCLRLFGLQRKILIVDEVHACDPYMHTLLQALLQFHAALGGSAILLSASLPHKMRAELAAAFACGAGMPTPFLSSSAYPLVTHIPATERETSVVARADLCREVQVQIFHDENSVLTFIKEKLEQGRCVCWMRNTVHDALTAYHLFSHIVPQDRLTLFHARFAMGDRLNIEHNVRAKFGPASTLAQRHGQLVLATQVVEQSLDLDFDVVVTDLAPMDRIIQRVGRLHRHQRQERTGEAPVLTVFSPAAVDQPADDWYSALFPKAAYVYQFHAQLWRTARLLAERGAWRQPDDVRTLIEAVFDEHAETPAALRRRDDRAYSKSLADISLAHFNALKLHPGYTDSGDVWADDIVTPTRLGEKSVSVRLARWEGATLVPWCNAARHAWAMSELSVRASLIASEAPHRGARAAAVDAAKESMPDKGQHAILLALDNVDGAWRATARNGNGKEIVVQYSRELGLTIV